MEKTIDIIEWMTLVISFPLKYPDVVGKIDIQKVPTGMMVKILDRDGEKICVDFSADGEDVESLVREYAEKKRKESNDDCRVRTSASDGA